MNRLLTKERVDEISCRLIGENCPDNIVRFLARPVSVERQLAALDVKTSDKIKAIKAGYYKQERLIKSVLYSSSQMSKL